MKITNNKIGFQPFELTIIVETKDELLSLLNRLELNVKTIHKTLEEYSSTSSKDYGINELENLYNSLTEFLPTYGDL